MLILISIMWLAKNKNDRADQFTGRTHGRTSCYSDGLHQAIEAKEGVPGSRWN